MRALEAVRQGGARIRNIVLEPLPAEDLGRLVADTVRASPAEAAPLASLVRDKTGGNPFFAIQFLTALYHKRSIWFDREAHRWWWDVARIRTEDYTDNIAELMRGRLDTLPEQTRAALRRAACLGGTIEAAYLLVPEPERAGVHLEIGRRLLASTAPDELPGKVFEIVSQLDRGAALIEARHERERVAELHLLAGTRAQDSTAYASALRYFTAGAEMLAADPGIDRPELGFALELHRARCELMTSAFGAAEQRLAELAQRAAGLLDLAAVTVVRIALYMALDRIARAVEASLEYLRRAGTEWSADPTSDEVRREYDRIWEQLGSRAIEDLVDLPPMTDPDRRATMDVLTLAQTPALFTDENLHALMICRVVNLSLEHGNSDASCLGYVELGGILRPRFGDPAAGFRFGQLGFDLLEQRGLLRWKARVYLEFGYRIMPWTKHPRASVELTRRAFDAAMEACDLMFAAYACNCPTTLDLLGGAPLEVIQAEAETALVFMQKAKVGTMVDIVSTTSRGPRSR